MNDKNCKKMYTNVFRGCNIENSKLKALNSMNDSKTKTENIYILTASGYLQRRGKGLNYIGQLYRNQVQQTDAPTMCR